MSYDILNDFKDCVLCPRNCHANRVSGPLGYCQSDYQYNIVAISKHLGEEPVISGEKGICNVFFSHCNMQCIYCQNHQISHNKNYITKKNLSLQEVVSRINTILDEGINMLGFVSPSHCVYQMKAIISALQEKRDKPIIVYNTNSYDTVETLKTLEGIVDIYLPDFKYADAHLAHELSDAPNYPFIALKAIKEMVRQKGIKLRLDETGQAISGVIIRHLVLPAYLNNSLEVIRLIAEEISPDIHISLMSQYFPTKTIESHPILGRSIYKDEYETVINKMEELGLFNGWLQDYESQRNYRPNFDNNDPFC